MFKTKSYSRLMFFFYLGFLSLTFTIHRIVDMKKLAGWLLHNYFFRVLSLAYLTLANLARLGNSVFCQISVRSQFLVRLLFSYWISGGNTIHPPIKGQLPSTGAEPTPFRNLASKLLNLVCMPLQLEKSS